jgi:predicted CXXCH cytochrome family protein
MSKRKRHARPDVAPDSPQPAGAKPIASPRRNWTLAAVALAVAIAAAGIALVWQPWRPVPAAVPVVAPVAASPPKFVGSEACIGCHAAEAKAWAGSQHAHAMQEANERTVAADFNDTRFEGGGTIATFSMRDGRFFVRTQGPDGKTGEFEVKYTFGVEPLQQYLVELPGGRLQALTVAWDTRAKRWFSLYPKEKIHAGDELHWTGRQLNWNFMCADCHSTDLRKNYDATAANFTTSWAEIHVGCESCHGPGSNHLAWAKRRDSDPKQGLTVMLKERAGTEWTIDPATGNATRTLARESGHEIEVCAQCHSRRAQIAEGYYAGKPFLDYYVPALLTAQLYYVDGQQRDEVYNWASFLQSKMYRHGVTCSDCHEPHGAKLRASGNALCAQCHSAQKYDSPAHHHHTVASPGAQCVECHMPNATYMIVDPRRDHGIRVPRPDLSVTLGVPNACDNCHDKKTAQWAADAIRDWYGHEVRSGPSFATTFRDAELQKPRAGASLIAVAADASEPAIVRASALDRLALDAGAGAVDAARSASRNADPLIRLAAARLAESLPPGDRGFAVGPLLADPLRAVRIEAANALAGAPQNELSPELRNAWQRAADDYVAAQRYNADRPEAHTNLGSFYARLGRFDAAHSEFTAALKLDPRYVPAYVNAADAYRAQRREEDAIRTLHEGIAAAPGSASLHYALGLAYVRAGQRAAALPEFARAVELGPSEARYAYVYAVALHSLGRSAEAVRALERDATRWPRNRDILFALATMERDAGHRDNARRAAQRLLEANPDDREARSLVEQLK